MSTTHATQEGNSLRFDAIVVFGPPLPGRAALARALEHRLPAAHRVRGGDPFPVDEVHALVSAGELPVIEADLVSARDRARLRRVLDRLGHPALFVAWMADPDEAQREVYRRYASLPKRYADRWWDAWQADEARREPLGPELVSDRLVSVGARGSVLDHVVRIAGALGLSRIEPAERPPRRRVLVVDDDDDQRTVVAATLEELGCDVARADGAEEALHIAERQPLDLVITDQQMPGASGTDLASILASRRPDLRIVILTGYAEETVDAALREDAVFVLLAKPARVNDLLRLLDELPG